MAVAALKDFVRLAVPRSIRNWLRSPKRSLVRLSDTAKFSLGITRSLQVTPEISVILHPHAFKVARREQINDPEQRAEVLNFIRHCESGMVFFDIGAHYGIFSLVAAHLGARVIAVEPSTVAVRMIARQAGLNYQTARIRTVLAAASNSSGTLEMLGSGVFSDDYFKLVEGRAPRELMKIRAVTVDSLTAEFGAPTHIKIDVEGQEAAVLQGSRQTLTQHSPKLFIELHNELISLDGGNPYAALDELRDLGYGTFALDGSPLDRSLIVQQPLIRIVAIRSVNV